jgi:hypothetical protein
VCIIDGGIKMRPRMKKLERYECYKCGKLWALTPNFIVIGSRGPIFDGYDNKGRKKWRQEGHCSCGVAFKYQTKTIQELKGE